MSKNKSILITGAAGFIGGYVAIQFKREGWNVLGIDRNPVNFNHPSRPIFDDYYITNLIETYAVRKILREHSPKLCIHLGGPSSVQQSFANTVLDFSSQMLPLLHLLDAIRHESPETYLLLISSAAVYGNPKSLPVREDQILDPISPYGFHKLMQESLVDEYGKLYGLKVCKARVFSTYGPGLRNLAVWDITNRAINNDFSIHGTGEETRDYLFVGDVATALHSIASNGKFIGESINLGSGNEASLLEIAHIIYSELGANVSPQLFPQLKGNGNPMRWRADVSTLRELGFTHTYELAQGIAETVKWIKKVC